jgi:hypothetical protein
MSRRTLDDSSARRLSATLLRLLRICPLALGASACGAGEDGVVRLASVTDSAGLRITAVSEEQLHALPFTKLTSPAQEVGGDEGVPLFRVRGARVLADGRLAILNGGSGEVLLLSREGDVVGHVGAFGDGPGEFGEPSAILRAGNGGIAVWDAARAESVVFDANGAYSRSDAVEVSRYFASFPRSMQIQPAYRWTQVDSARLLIFDYAEMTELPGEGALFRPPYNIVSGDFRGTDFDTLGTYGSLEQMRLPMSARGAVVPAVQGANTHWAYSTSDGRIALADGAKPVIDVYDGSGGRVGVFRMALPSRDVDAERAATDRASLAETLTRRGVQDASAIVNRIPDPTAAPAITGLTADADGVVWVELYARASDGAERYVLFDSEGALVGGVELAPNDGLLDVAFGEVVVLVTDSLGVETVARYAIPPLR